MDTPSKNSAMAEFLEHLIQLQLRYGVVLQQGVDLCEVVPEDQRASHAIMLADMTSWTFGEEMLRHQYQTQLENAPLVEPVADALLPKAAHHAMRDSVRQLLIHMHTPGITFGQIRRMVDLAGINTTHWPAWMDGRDNEHFNKAARADLLWHCMAHAALNGYDDD